VIITMPRGGFALAGLVAVALLAVLPDAAHACPVCFDARDENRQAFLATTIFLSLFPLGMVAGTGIWIRKRSKALDAEEAAAREAREDQTDQGA